MYICSEQESNLTYHPHLERFSVYKSIWSFYWDEFVKIYPNRFFEIYGELDRDKAEEVNKLISCGKFKNGFQRSFCPHCGTELVVPFTCKSRLCLSCSRKKLFGWSINLSEILFTSLNHRHVTFTIPGRLSRILFERQFEVENMIKLAAGVYNSILESAKGYKRKEEQPGIIATVHKSGNSLNYNPHVHLIGTEEAVNIKTGEVIAVPYVEYKKARIVWMKAFLGYLVSKGIITDQEAESFTLKHKSGFHVYFQPIRGDENEVLFRTAEYIASNYFNNSQIINVDHDKKTVTFRYKKSVDRKNGKKIFSEKTMNVMSFMARMLFFLPDKHRKMIRYYGLYYHGIDEKLKRIDQKTWARAIEHSFNVNPEICPDCNELMFRETVYSFNADKVIQKLFRTHVIEKGYFKVRKPP